MITSGYNITLYCDNEYSCLFYLLYNEGYHEVEQNEYDGETFAKCARQARIDGWKISKDKTKCYCPECGGPRTVTQ